MAANAMSAPGVRVCDSEHVVTITAVVEPAVPDITAKLGGIPTGSFQAYLSQPHRTLSDDQHASLAKVIADRRAA
jgi:hypothetical protein